MLAGQKAVERLVERRPGTAWRCGRGCPEVGEWSARAAGREPGGEDAAAGGGTESSAEDAAAAEGEEPPAGNGFVLCAAYGFPLLVAC